jgi:exopolysaccharide production protein ExoZ
MVTTPAWKLQTVQAARGAAAMLVLLFHLTYLAQAFLGFDLLRGVFKFGYSGVDFFFVLSGFIIHFVHGQDVGRPERLGRYLRKRFVRIYPVYWVVALALLPVYFNPAQSTLSPQFYLSTLLKSLLLLPQANNPLVTVAWTLTFEVFFYFMFALAIITPHRFARVLIALWLLLSFITYLDKLGAAGFFGGISPAKIRGLNFVFSFYNLEFALGCATAHLLKRHRIRHGGKLALLAVALFLTVGVLNSLLYQRFDRVEGVLLYSLPAALFVVGAVSWETRRGVALPPVLLLLGDASYSIYLTHYALLDLFAKASISRNMPAVVGVGFTLLIIFSLTFSAGILFFILVERPLLRRLGRRDKSLNRGLDNPQLAVTTEGEV